MKFFSNCGDKYLKETDCIGISASPENLRALANFISEAAKELEEMGGDFDHIHLMDKWSGWTEGAPDIQIFNEKI